MTLKTLASIVTLAVRVQAMMWITYWVIFHFLKFSILQKTSPPQWVIHHCRGIQFCLIYFFHRGCKGIILLLYFICSYIRPLSKCISPSAAFWKLVTGTELFVKDSGINLEASQTSTSCRESQLTNTLTHKNIRDLPFIIVLVCLLFIYTICWSWRTWFLLLLFDQITLIWSEPGSLPFGIVCTL